LAETTRPQTAGDDGAVVVFEGIVRRLENGRPISGLTYDVYSPMAENLLQELGQSLIHDFGVTTVIVEHSRGFVPVGQCSFRLVVSGCHRQEVFRAAQWFIDRLKEDVPIWKKPVPAQAGTG
jgi:molybdopterin synthase catalytic subunit